MTTSMAHFSTWATLGLVGLMGALGTARAGVIESSGALGCRQLPVIKNMTGLKAQRVCDTLTAKELTRKDIKELTANAKSYEDHLTLARYFRAKADALDARAAGYEEGAARVRTAPAVKNLASPTTAARYGFLAKGFRDEAKANHALATSHEEMAKYVVAKLWKP
jgi:hypothetical protein